MDSILSEGVLDIIFFSSAVPVGVELVYLAGGLAHFLNIKGLVDLAEAALAEQA